MSNEDLRKPNYDKARRQKGLSNWLWTIRIRYAHNQRIGIRYRLSRSKIELIENVMDSYHVKPIQQILFVLGLHPY